MLVTKANPNEEIVDGWFKDIARNVPAEEGLDTDRPAGYIKTDNPEMVNRGKINDGYIRVVLVTLLCNTNCWSIFPYKIARNLRMILKELCLLERRLSNEFD